MATQVATSVRENGTGSFGADLGVATVAIGESFGLYEVMSESGPLPPPELAERTGMPEPHVRSWLGAQVAGGYVVPDGRADGYANWCRWPRS